MSTSSPPQPELRSIPLSRLRPHPANANVMGPDAMRKLERHISRTGTYPPLVVRPLDDDYQLVDGHQRARALLALGHDAARCYVWACDDRDALLLLSTLNRLHGEDVPARRGALLDELLDSFDRDVLLELIPDDAGQLDELLALARGEEDPFAALEAEAEQALSNEPVAVTFVVGRDEEPALMAAIDRRIEGQPGPRSRGAALVQMVRALEGQEQRHA